MLYYTIVLHCSIRNYDRAKGSFGLVGHRTSVAKLRIQSAVGFLLQGFGVWGLGFRV